MMKAELEKDKERILKEFNIDNCRVCIDIKDWSRRAQKLAFSGQPTSRDASPTSAATAGATASTVLGSRESTTPIKECPPDALELGRSTWTFLHTMAAYYPDKPTLTQQTEMGSLIDLFSKYYPCGYCASHLREEMTRDPPQTQSRGHLTKWFCRIHNEVNERLGKPLFNCDQLDSRWRDGPSDGSCLTKVTSRRYIGTSSMKFCIALASLPALLQGALQSSSDSTEDCIVCPKMMPICRCDQVKDRCMIMRQTCRECAKALCIPRESKLLGEEAPAEESPHSPYL